MCSAAAGKSCRDSRGPGAMRTRRSSQSRMSPRGVDGRGRRKDMHVEGCCEARILDISARPTSGNNDCVCPCARGSAVDRECGESVAQELFFYSRVCSNGSGCDREANSQAEKLGVSGAARAQRLVLVRVDGSDTSSPLCLLEGRCKHAHPLTGTSVFILDECTGIGECNAHTRSKRQQATRGYTRAQQQHRRVAVGAQDT